VKQEKNYDQEIQNLIFERDSLAITNSIEGQLAIILHDKYCGYNHTDGCGWLYGFKNGFHSWNDHPHNEYLEVAKKIVSESETLRSYIKP
jgi:hypothetical protein